MKILILGEAFTFQSAAAAFRELGHEVLIHQSGEKYHLSKDQLKKYFDDFKPDFCLARNRRPFDRAFNPYALEISEYIKISGIPYICWFLENPLASGGYDAKFYYYFGKHKNCLSLCFSETSVMELRALGHKADYLPMAADVEAFYPVQAPSYDFDITFIGQPKSGSRPQYANLDALWHLSWVQLMERSKKSLEGFQVNIVPSYVGGFFKSIEDSENVDWGSFKKIEETYEQMLDMALHQNLKAHFMVLSGRLQMYKILHWVMDAGYPLRLFGGKKWQEFFPKHPPTDFVPDDKMSEFYAGSKINLVPVKLELRDVVHQRVFTISACKGFQLAEDRPAIHKLFASDEVITFSSKQDLLEKVDYYLARPDLRRECAEKAYSRVMQEHTFLIRMQQMLDLFYYHGKS